jgi:hypothetical protein
MDVDGWINSWIEMDVDGWTYRCRTELDGCRWMDKSVDGWMDKCVDG